MIRDAVVVDENFAVSVSKSAYEVIATYEKEESGMDLVIRLPSCYPLCPVYVDCTRSLGISEVKQRKWLLSMIASVRNQNGAMAEAMRIWKRDKAGAVYIKLANCHLKLESKHEAASAYVDASKCYKKISAEESINLFMEIGRLNMAARYCKEIGELYELEKNIEQAMDYYERSADLFQSEEVTTSANQCKQKVAQFAAQNRLVSNDEKTKEEVWEKEDG
ncbi:hypothetical protein AAC387_Pa01g3952 [Persea americana]